MPDTRLPINSETSAVLAHGSAQSFLGRLGELGLNEKIAWIVLLVSWLFTFLVWQNSSDALLHSQQRQFQNRTSEVTEAVIKRMQGYEQVLRGGIGLFSASESVNRNAWKEYVASLRVEEYYPGIQGIGFSVYIPPANLDSHLRKMRAEGFPDYAIRPPGLREAYTSIIYLEPFDERNKRAFGFDMFSEANRHAAMARARDSGETSITARVKLVQESGQKVQAGMLMYLPAYKNGKPHSTIEERNANLLGYVYSPFRMNDLMSGILKNKNEGVESDVDVELYDGKIVSPDSLLYDNDENPQAIGAQQSNSLTVTKTINLYGHEWTLHLSARPAFHAMFDEGKPMRFLLTGAALGLLLFTLVWMLGSQRRRAMDLASEMSAEAVSTADKLRTAMSFQNAIFNSTNYAIISTDSDGIIRSFNAAAEKLLGYQADEVIGKVSAGFLHDPQEVISRAEQLSQELRQDIAPGFEAFVAKAKLGLSDENEWTYIRKNGSRVPVHLSVSALLDATDTAVGFVGVATDISERKAAEQASLDGKSRLKAILDNVLDAIITINEVGAIETCNKAAEKIFGYESSEMVGQNVKMLMPAPYQEQHDGYLHNYVSTGKKKIIGIGRQVVGRRKDGSVFPMDLAVSEMMMGEKRMFTGIVRDITERVKVERMKSEFVSTVSHELRTPLTSIRGALGLIAGGVAGELPAQAKSLVDIAHKNSERLILLVNDILDMEKIESGKMNFNLQPVGLIPLVGQALEANKAYAEQFNVTYEFKPSQNSPQINIDADRFMQVLANLLSNAAKFSPAGGVVTVTVQVHAHVVRVSVSDNGSGIPEEFKSKIFQKFSQADSSDTRTKGGTGLGLSITQAIVNGMGGKIGFSSEVGVGSTFFIEFPEYSTDVLVQPELQKGGTSRNRILICEDDRDVAKLLQMVLQQGGYDSDIAHSAKEAKELLRRMTYDAMTLDIMMAEQDGISLLRELHADADTSDLPVIVVSATANQYKNDLESGIVVLDWISKPIDETRLLSALQRVTGKKGSKPVILHVEDDGDICQVLLALVGNEGTVVVAPSLAEAKRKVVSEHIDLIILDLGLPDGSGLDLLTFLSEQGSDVPVMIFSATELNEEVVQQVKSMLVKSRTSNEQLLAKIKQLINIS